MQGNTGIVKKSSEKLERFIRTNEWTNQPTNPPTPWSRALHEKL